VSDKTGTDGLDASARRRLERFEASFNRINAHDYVQLATVPPAPEATARAQADAVRLLGTGARRDATRAAVATFVDAAGVAYSSHLALPQFLFLYDGVTDRPDDRQRFLQTLERAVVALILWDELGDDDRDTLVGPWASIVDAAVEGE
jgi:hypothetical protein